MNNQLRATAVALTVLSTLSLATFVAADASSAAPAASPSKDAKIARGAYLVTFGGCNDCHTPFKLGPNGPEPDMSRMLSGHPQQMVLPPPPAPAPGPWMMTVAATNTAWSGPWGISYTANLTPDAATGLGQWTEQEFVDAMRSGRHRGRGRQILPPMPWPGIGQATDEDLSAIFAFLRSVPAIPNQVPEPVLAPMPAH